MSADEFKYSEFYFSDYFKITPEHLEQYGAFNISLVSDLPLFIDPFLLFNSKNKQYKQLHDNIIKYLIFLKKKSTLHQDRGALKAWYMFKEVKQNWLGFSIMGNNGSALGISFAIALNKNLHKIFNNFGEEEQQKITLGSHLEKLCLIKDGVGRDNISDFSTNLIKGYLLEYTQNFAQKYIDAKLRKTFRVQRVHFNYKTQTWEERTFDLPNFKNDFVILTPKNLLTKDNTWINKSDLIKNFEQIPNAIPDEQLRFQINNHFHNQLSLNQKNKGKEPAKKEKLQAAISTINQFPEIIDYYIKHKEDSGQQAENISSKKVDYSKQIFEINVRHLRALLQKSNFYTLTLNSYQETKNKLEILKEYIENNDGYKFFYYNN